MGTQTVGIGVVGPGLPGRGCRFEAVDGEIEAVLYPLDDGAHAVEDPHIHVLVDTSRSSDPRLVERALTVGKPVVSSNSVLAATWGPRLRRVAAMTATSLYEAAAALPTCRLVTAATDRLGGDTIDRIDGILSAEANSLILRQEWHLSGRQSPPRRIDPESTTGATADGALAGERLAIVAQTLISEDVSDAHLYRLGLGSLTPEDIAEAVHHDERWRLVATATRHGCLRVEPILLPRDHALATVPAGQLALSVTTVTGRHFHVEVPGPSRRAQEEQILADVAKAIRSPSVVADLEQSEGFRNPGPSRAIGAVGQGHRDPRRSRRC